MKDENSQEPIETLRIHESKVILLGTAHISKKSVEEVQKIIQKEKPDTICVELCESRMQSISDPQRWQKLDIFKVFKERKMYLLLSSLILSSFQKKLGLDDVKPGDEMRIAIEEGKKIEAKILPVDRDISKTLKRAWWNVSFFSKFYLLSVLITSLFVKEEIDSEKIEKMKSRDALDDLFEQLPKKYSSIKKIIIDERDMYLAQKIREATKTSKVILAVVGAGHLKGILNHIQQDNYIEHLNTLPEKNAWGSLKTFIPAVLFLSLISSIFLLKDQQTGQDFISKWILLKGGLAALGAIIALAHPLAILTAFVSAPIGTFIPIFKPGWTAALCQIWFKKPLVKDFENIAEDTTSFTGYWKNHVVRIFLVLLFPQIGSSIGTILLTMEAFKIFF